MGEIISERNIYPTKIIKSSKQATQEYEFSNAVLSEYILWILE